MRQLILHIGMHKTGSTSIQRSLDGLSTGGAKYVCLNNVNHTGPMLAAFRDGPKKRHRPRADPPPDKQAELMQRMRKKLERQLAQKQFDKFIISGEGIVRLPVRSLTDMRKLLSKHVDRIGVFAYVREPVGWSSSALQQRVKQGYGGYELSLANYRDKFKPFMEVFGRDNFSVGEFSKSKLRDGSVVADFCHRWNIPFDAAREVRRNESLSEATLKLLHLFNREGTPWQADRHFKHARMRMVDALSTHFQGRFELPAHLRAAAIDRRDVDWLAAKCGIVFPVDAVRARVVPESDFEQYFKDIDSEVVSSYRELLAGHGIPVRAADSTVELLNKHFQACLTDTVKEKENESAWSFASSARKLARLFRW